MKRGRTETESITKAVFGKPDIKRLAASIESRPETINNTMTLLNMTPLIFECCVGPEDTTRLQMLLACPGRNINAQDKSGYTALMFAALRSVSKLRLLLAEKDIDVNIQNDKGETALMKAGCDTEEFLLKRDDIDLEVTNNRGYTALQEAVAFSVSGKTLVRYGASTQNWQKWKVWENWDRPFAYFGPSTKKEGPRIHLQMAIVSPYLDDTHPKRLSQ